MLHVYLMFRFERLISINSPVAVLQSPEMSAYTLQRIESAFSTNRDQYSQFETAVNANNEGCYNPSLTPVVITTNDCSKISKSDDLDTNSKVDRLGSSIGEQILLVT